MSAVTMARRETIKKSKACRNLFGPVDHEKVRKDLESQLNMDNSSTNEWNFNFSKGIPCEGRYEWTEESTEYVPEFYRKGYTTRVPPTPRKMNVQPVFENSVIKKPTAVRRLNILFRDTESQTASRSAELSDNAGPASTTVPTAVHTTSTPRAPRRRLLDQSQARISDFYGIRKRRAECDSPNTTERKLPRI